MIEYLHAAASLIGIVAGIAVLYVSKSMLSFRIDFVKELEVKFVGKEVYIERENAHATAHKTIWRAIDKAEEEDGK